MAESEDEIQALKRRLAELEANRPAAPPGPGPLPVRPVATSGFGQGFFGCFGWAAAIALVLFVLVTCSLVRGSDPAPDVPPDMASSAYQANCAAGLAQAQRRSRRFADAALSYLAPAVIAVGSPQRVQCGVVSPRGTGTIVIDVSCAGSDATCTRLMSAVLAGEVVLGPSR